MPVIKTAKPSSPRRKVWVMGILCAACCAVPLVGIAFGSAAIAALSTFSVGAAIAVAVVGGTLLAYKYIFRRKASACDIGCDCHPMPGKDRKPVSV